MENIYRAHPELLANNNWHSQSSINGTAAFLHMGKDPEGRALLANNVKRLGLKGMAITKIGYTKLDNLLHGLNPKIDLFYMRNQKSQYHFLQHGGCQLTQMDLDMIILSIIIAYMI